MSVRQSKGVRPRCGRCPSRLHEQDAQVDHKSDETGLSQRLSIASHRTPGGTCRKGPISHPHSSPSRPVNSGTPPRLAPVLPRSENSFGRFATLQEVTTKRKGCRDLSQRVGCCELSLACLSVTAKSARSGYIVSMPASLHRCYGAGMPPLYCCKLAINLGQNLVSPSASRLTRETGTGGASSLSLKSGRSRDGRMRPSRRDSKLSQCHNK
jgi:hypothetical protein